MIDMLTHERNFGKETSSDCGAVKPEAIAVLFLVGLVINGIPCLYVYIVNQKPVVLE